MTNTTNTNNTADFDRMVYEYKVAYNTFVTSKVGSAKGDKAERKMDRLYAEAERMGFASEFGRAVFA